MLSWNPHFENHALEEKSENIFFKDADGKHIFTLQAIKFLSQLLNSAVYQEGSHRQYINK